MLQFGTNMRSVAQIVLKLLQFKSVVRVRNCEKSLKKGLKNAVAPKIRIFFRKMQNCNPPFSKIQVESPFQVLKVEKIGQKSIFR